jgi:uncharacterized protein
MNRKYRELQELLMSYKKACVAFSGGVDSTFLLKVAANVLKDNVYAIVVKSDFMPDTEFFEAEEFLINNSIKYDVIEFDINSDSNIVENSKDRCYYCKYRIFNKIKNISQNYNIDIVIDGSNKDDETDFRPGTKALNELGIKSPLKEVGLTKEEIRSLSKGLGLRTWDKPAYACLASRIPYNTVITVEKLNMIEKAEEVLRELGFRQFRVRYHEKIARIELMPQDRIKVFKDNIDKIIINKFTEIGFTYITLDLSGYEMGKLNKEIL